MAVLCARITRGCALADGSTRLPKAGLDGLRNRIEPPDPIDEDLYELPPEEHGSIQQVPGSLPEVLTALEADTSDRRSPCGPEPPS